MSFTEKLIVAKISGKIMQLRELFFTYLPFMDLLSFQLLATGLSGLYSLLPRRLDGKSVNTDSNFRLTHEDVSRIPELENFLSSLEFCDAVIQVHNSPIYDKCQQ